MGIPYGDGLAEKFFSDGATGAGAVIGTRVRGFGAIECAWGTVGDGLALFGAVWRWVALGCGDGLALGWVSLW